VKLSVLTPAFNEAANLRNLYQQLAPALDALTLDWEWIVVDDHSRDTTFEVLTDLATRDARVRGVRLSRNAGSHTAISCGLHLASGDAAVIMAADLQDPPETLRAMIERWRAGAQVVWAVRRTRSGEPSHAGFAALYYWVMRHPVGLKEIPERGADFCLVDRVVVEALRQFPERNVNVLALITWMGFRQEQIEYDKRPRAAGQSGWTTARKVEMVVDSITSFSSFPIRLCLTAGMALIVVGAVAVLAGLFLLPSLGAGVLLLLGLVTALAGVQLAALGVIGEYVWRALDESRRRPSFLIEAVTPAHAAAMPLPDR
jgi:dolichol-phosphate mannosyltransferase